MGHSCQDRSGQTFPSKRKVSLTSWPEPARLLVLCEVAVVLLRMPPTKGVELSALRPALSTGSHERSANSVLKIGLRRAGCSARPPSSANSRLGPHQSVGLGACRSARWSGESAPRSIERGHSIPHLFKSSTARGRRPICCWPRCPERRSILGEAARRDDRQEGHARGAGTSGCCTVKATPDRRNPLTNSRIVRTISYFFRERISFWPVVLHRSRELEQLKLPPASPKPVPRAGLPETRSKEGGSPWE
jgi:hypothetical protein